MLIFFFIKKSNNLFFAKLEYPSNNIFKLNSCYLNLSIFKLPNNKRASISIFLFFIKPTI
jgi:hypothetical protein